MMRIPFILFLGIVFSGCYKNHLYVQQEWVDRNFLASTHVNTPDPRKECPYEGQRILISWKFPPCLVNQTLRLVATIRFWDNSEEVFTRPICRSLGNTAFFFPNQRILTYRLQVFNEQDEVVEVWEHHFWTELIDLDRSSDCVSSQPKQGSVTETP